MHGMNGGSNGNGGFQLRRRPRDDEEHWQLSLADMMTLLLCFFVLIVSISVVDYERFDKVSEAMSDALTLKKGPAKKTKQPKPVPEPVEAPSPTVRKALNAQVIKQKSLNEVVRDLEERLGLETDAVRLERRDGSVAVNLHGPVFFELGSAELTLKAAHLLRDIAGALEGLPYKYTVEGHTDDIPIRTARFPSNWELSSARASSVARFLIGRGVSGKDMKVVGLADTRPLAPNRDPQGVPIAQNQIANRRVVILLSPR